MIAHIMVLYCRIVVTEMVKTYTICTWSSASCHQNTSTGESGQRGRDIALACLTFTFIYIMSANGLGLLSFPEGLGPVAIGAE